MQSAAQIKNQFLHLFISQSNSHFENAVEIFLLQSASRYLIRNLIFSCDLNIFALFAENFPTCAISQKCRIFRWGLFVRFASFIDDNLLKPRRCKWQELASPVERSVKHHIRMMPNRWGFCACNIEKSESNLNLTNKKSNH